MSTDDCFAYKRGSCHILTVKKCQGEGCNFKKTPQEYADGEKKAMKRINSLNSKIRNNIIMIYYKDKSWAFDCVE